MAAILSISDLTEMVATNATVYYFVCEDNLTHLIHLMGLHHFSISQNKWITPTWACPSLNFMLLKYSYHPCSVALSDRYLCGHCLNVPLPIAQRNTNCHCIRPKSKQMWVEYRIFLIIAQSSLNIPGLVNIQKAIEHGNWNSGFTH